MMCIFVPINTKFAPVSILYLYQYEGNCTLLLIVFAKSGVHKNLVAEFVLPLYEARHVLSAFNTHIGEPPFQPLESLPLNSSA